MAQLIGVLLTKLAAPLVDRFIRGDNPMSEQELFHVTAAQAEAKIQPTTAADDLGREAVMLVSIRRWCLHVTSIAHRVGAGQIAQ
jgi:hypothetical protein